MRHERQARVSTHGSNEKKAASPALGELAAEM